MKTYLCLLLSVCTFFGLTAQEKSFEDKIKRMLEINGSKESFDVVITNMIELQKQSYNDQVDDQFFDKFEDEIRKDGFESIVELLIPIYKKHLAEDDLDTIIKFYETDAAKALVEKTPIIIQESMSVGAEWGEQLALKVIDKIENSNEMRFKRELPEDACEAFKEGNFEMFYVDESTTPPTKHKILIERNGNFQVEKMNSNTSHFKLNWLSDCRYTIEQTDEDKISLGIGVLEVNIFEVNEKSYKFICKASIDEDLYLEGEVFKVKGRKL